MFTFLSLSSPFTTTSLCRRLPRSSLFATREREDRSVNPQEETYQRPTRHLQTLDFSSFFLLFPDLSSLASLSRTLFDSHPVLPCGSWSSRPSPSSYALLCCERARAGHTSSSYFRRLQHALFLTYCVAESQYLVVVLSLSLTLHSLFKAQAHCHASPRLLSSCPPPLFIPSSCALPLSKGFFYSFVRIRFSKQRSHPSASGIRPSWVRVYLRFLLSLAMK